MSLSLFIHLLMVTEEWQDYGTLRFQLNGTLYLSLFQSKVGLKNFRKYFPEAEQPEEKMASCLTWQPIPLLQKEYSVLAEELSTLLDERHPKRKIKRAKQALYDAYVESERSLDEIIDLIQNADEWI